MLGRAKLARNLSSNCWARVVLRVSPAPHVLTLTLTLGLTPTRNPTRTPTLTLTLTLTLTVTLTGDPYSAARAQRGPQRRRVLATRATSALGAAARVVRSMRTLPALALALALTLALTLSLSLSLTLTRHAFGLSFGGGALEPGNA